MSTEHSGIDKVRVATRELPSSESIALILSKIEAGDLPLRRLAEGVYNNVFEIETNTLGDPDSHSAQEIVLKILGSDSSVEKSLDKATNRYSTGEKLAYDLEVFASLESVNLSNITTEDPVVLNQLLQLVLQYEVYKRYLGKHILPKQFAILNLDFPLIGEEITPRALELYESMVDPSSGQGEMVIDEGVELQELPGGMKGRVCVISLPYTSIRCFREYLEDEPGKLFSIVGGEGSDVVEVQRKLNFKTVADEEIMQPEVAYNLGNDEIVDELWDDELAIEMWSFIEKLITMVQVGVSIDAGYRKVPFYDISILVSSGAKRIVLHDTNNWEVSDSNQRFSSTTSSDRPPDPFPGIVRSNVHSTLRKHLVSPLIDKLEKALIDKKFKIDCIRDEVEQVIAKLKIKVGEQTVENIESENEPREQEARAYEMEIGAKYDELDNLEKQSQDWIDLKVEIRRMYDHYRKLCNAVVYPSNEAFILKSSKIY